MATTGPKPFGARSQQHLTMAARLKQHRAAGRAPLCLAGDRRVLREAAAADRVDVTGRRAPDRSGETGWGIRGRDHRDGETAIFERTEPVNYDATIRELEEKRDFYAAAISALKKIATHETAQPTETRRRKTGSGHYGPRTPEEKARLSEIAKARWAKRRENAANAAGNGTQPHADIVQ